MGTVVAVTPNGHLTLRAPGPRATVEGSFVTDSSGRIEGKVYRVFGPVSQPYLTVRLRRVLRAQDAPALLGSVLLRGDG
ncbi:MAG: hypothetical protein L3K09_03880 [Thermoplasmata archaeon]|nr:hypothetical protein [Thermoplasmata archaeon]